MTLCVVIFNNDVCPIYFQLCTELNEVMVIPLRQAKDRYEQMRLSDEKDKSEVAIVFVALTFFVNLLHSIAPGIEVGSFFKPPGSRSFGCYNYASLSCEYNPLREIATDNLLSHLIGTSAND